MTYTPSAGEIFPATENILTKGASKRRTATRVLAVDDEPAALKLLALILSPPGFHCVTAKNGEEAVVTLQSQRFDVVISDLRMPGIDGMELLAEARRHHPHVAFLIVTGNDDVEVGVQAMRSGADDYLVKPLLDCVVIASLERSLRKRQLERQVENYRQHLETMVEERTGQLRAALQQVERSYEHTLQALGTAIDLRDDETAGHSRRVCCYSLEIASAIRLSDLQLSNIARGAYLHDIGKLGIPDSILLKPGPLTPGERERMQQHVRIGFDIVKGIPFLADAAEILLTHHERFDGSGYPRGLKKDEIPIGGKIFAVADAFDAITTDRPYRRASSFESARETIRRLAGSQFDPQVVDVFLNVPKDTWPTIAQNPRLVTGLPAKLLNGQAFLDLP
ncbi:MAG TPA: HD domain-containing phosphohydrolase [Candidatus Acidoferrum sp.]|nr:HD domain-containing phosphohydrolase [Candidatus Acidoferrum sp.]